MSAEGQPLPPQPLLWAPQAWLGGRWQAGVMLRIDARGCWAAVQAGVPPPPGAQLLNGPVLPGLVNAHSHAFQRAFAGLAERREGEQDDFWSWRERMYAVALRMSPEALEAIAAQLYAEMLQGGFTQVCEFHYLHHAPDGRPYDDPLAMAQALQRAARRTGIGLTLLPVLYERAGFAQDTLRDNQRRFGTSVQQLLAWRAALRAGADPLLTVGVAIHSLRAARPASVRQLAEALAGDPAPIHLHIAEQTAEVADCLAATGLRPIEWLLQHQPPDARWQLVHATHATPAEIDGVARSGAGVVICPSTEANLGDGLTDVAHWLQAGTVLSVGTDSHVGRQWPAELRLLDYGQRLQRRQRNVAAAPQQGQASTAARLFDRLAPGGAAAAGFARWGFEPGARADWLVIDTQAPGLLGVPGSHGLDALVFATEGPVFSEVGVAGRPVLRHGRLPDGEAIARRFAGTMAGLWGGG